MQPSEQGRRRYPPDGIFREAKEVGPVACRCNDACRNPCQGECGCIACAVRFCTEQSKDLGIDG